MEMDSMWGIIGVVVAACGVYALYSFIVMKKNGSISAALLLGKDCTENMCKDKENYIKKVAPALLIFGIVTTIYGVLDIIHCYVYSMPVVDTCGMIIFLAVLVWFAVYTTKLKKQYFRLR